MKKACLLLFVTLGIVGVSQAGIYITNTALPEATVNDTYTARLGATNGAAPYAWNVVQRYTEHVRSNELLTATNAMGWTSQTNGWWYALPFTFPFYGVGYTQCYVTTEGYLHFTSEYLDDQPSTNKLMTNCMIAVDWKNLSTEFFVGGEDIYTDNSATQCVIRWNATVSMGFNPADVSVYLMKNGDIKIDTSGDADMMSQPVIGVSAGTGFEYTLSTNMGTFWMWNQYMQFDSTNGLPDALRLSSTGSLYGAPSSTGTWAVAFRAVDASGVTTAKTLSIVAAENSNRQPVIHSNVPPAGNVGLLENSTNFFTVYATDPEAAPLDYTWRLNGSLFATNTNAVAIVMAWGDAGMDTLRVTLSDGFWTNDEVYSEWTLYTTNDNDSDGMPNAWERRYGLNPNGVDASADPDDDTLTNLEEFQNGCSPTNNDTDGDSLLDHWEIENGLNATSAYESIPGYTNWTQWDSLYLTAHARGIAMNGDTAYVACGHGGLKVFDISDPSTPQLLDMLDSPENRGPDSLWYHEGYIYLPMDEIGLWIVDVSQPTNVVKVGEYTNSSSFFGPVFVESNRVYMAQNRDLVVLSVTNKAAPEYLGEIRISSTNGAYHIHDVRARGRWVYCANYTEGLKTVDARNPMSMSITYTNDFTAVGVCDYAARGLDLEGDKLFMCQDGYGLMSFDLSTSSVPSLLDNFIPSSVPFPYDALDNVWVEGTNAFVIGGTNFWTLDVGDPSNLSEQGKGTLRGPGFYDVAFHSNVGCLAVGFGTVPGMGLHRGGLITVDLTDRTHPVTNGQYITCGQTWDLQVQGDRAYIANYHAGLRIVHLVNQTNLFKGKRYDTPGTAIGLDVTGDYVLVADGDNGLMILDVGAPTGVTVHAQVNNIGRVEDVAYNNGYIYVANYTNGLLIMTNLASPAILTRYSQGVPHYALAEYGSIVYAGCGGSGVYAYYNDFKSSGLVWQVTGYDYTTDTGTGCNAGRMDAANQKLWIADNITGIVCLDISSSTNLSYVGVYRNPMAQCVYVADDYVWAGSSTNIVSFRTDDYSRKRGICEKNNFWDDPYMKGIWCDRNDGFFIGNLGSGRYMYGMRTFYMTRVDDDDDGMRDSDEIAWFGDTDETRTGDYDGDGLNNWGESVTATDPTLEDTDGDGLTDREEYIVGSDPVSDGSGFFMEIPMAGMELFEEFVFRWESHAGRTYDLYRWSDIRNPDTRKQLLTNAPATPPMNTYTDTIFAAFSYVYQVQVRIADE